MARPASPGLERLLERDRPLTTRTVVVVAACRGSLTRTRTRPTRPHLSMPDRGGTHSQNLRPDYYVYYAELYREIFAT